MTRKPVADSPRSDAANSEGDAIDQDSEFGQWVTASQPGARFRIFRRMEETAKWGFHGVLERDSVSEAGIAGLWGGGTYMAQRLKTTQTGADAVDSSRKIIIPGEYMPPRGRLPGVSRETAAAPAVAGAPAPAASTGNVTREFLDQALASKVLDLLNGSGRQSVDWAAIIGPAIAGTVALVTAVMNRPVPTPVTDPKLALQVQRMTDLLERSLRRENAAAPGGPSEMRGMTRTIRELVSLKEALGDATGGGDKQDRESVMWEAIPKLLDRMMGNNAPQQLAPGESAEPSQGPDTRAPWQQMLGNYHDELVNAARFGMRPQMVAELVATRIPGEWQGVLVEFLQREDVRDAMVAEVPEMQHFPKFADELIAELRSEMFGADDEGDDEDEPPVTGAPALVPKTKK